MWRRRCGSGRGACPRGRQLPRQLRRRLRPAPFGPGRGARTADGSTAVWRWPGSRVPTNTFPVMHFAQVFFGHECCLTIFRGLGQHALSPIVKLQAVWDPKINWTESLACMDAGVGQAMPPPMQAQAYPIAYTGGNYGYVWNLPQWTPATSMALFVPGHMQYAGQQAPDSAMPAGSQVSPLLSPGYLC